MNTLVLLLNEFYCDDLTQQNGYNIVKLKQLINFRGFEKIVIVLDGIREVNLDAVLKIFCEHLCCDKNIIRFVESINRVIYEVIPINTDDFYVFMPVSAMNKDNPLHDIFEKMQPNKKIRLCLIGVPEVIDNKFDTEVELPPITNGGSVFEDLWS
ncbi:MAG: hypothetical protein LBB20_01610 [Puniceicoccales bacterium]|jgi:hypothetical protein|nr:hypothetical protein [Puniceicoccales bacterium]